MELITALNRFRQADRVEDWLNCAIEMYKDGDYQYLVDFRKAIKPRVRENPDYMDFLKRSYDASAKEVFRDFCIATEWNRDDKFFLPRQKGLGRIVEQLQRLADDELDLLCISMPPGVGKALANDTRILTRNGWKNHGDLVIGDEVIGMDGKFKKVINVMPKCMLDCLVEFTNGEKIQCHERHEWLIYDHALHENHTHLSETWRLEKRHNETGTPGKRGHRYCLQIPFKKPVEGEKKELSVDPYILGVWLGDGSNRQPRICGDKKDIVVLDEVAKKYPQYIETIHKDTGVVYRDFRGLRQDLQKYGMCFDKRRSAKRIPQDYLTASIEQRLELLAGLLDTDGCRSDKKYQFTTSDEFLKYTFIELVSTFGWRCSIQRNEPSISSGGIVGRRPYWVIQFTPSMYIPCRLERKQLKAFGMQRKLAIKSITRVEPKEGNCITVEGGMYLAGKTMIPTHNTATAIYFLCWLVGRNSKDGILCGSHNASFLRGMYEECVRELKPGDYRWGEIFRGHSLEHTNALDMKIDVDQIQRFSSLQFGSIGSGLAGKLRAVQLLYCDDLVEGIEEALSKDRLEKKWQQYVTDYRQRKQGNCKELHIATRWSVRDVIGMLKEEYEGNPRAEFLTMSALNEKGDSNFDYGGSQGFTTEFFEDIKATMDDISWKALYMNEPVEREGLLYPEESLRRFYEIPSEEPDAIIGVCDTAEGGGDSTVLPVFAVYGNDHYLIDLVCSDALPEVTDTLCANVLVKNNVQKCQFESNSAGGRTADKVQELVKMQNGRCSITKKRTTANKETKIIVNSDWIKQHCIFLDEKKIEKGSMYYRFMQQMMSYTMMGKNKHDDTVDALAQYALFTEALLGNVVKIAKRPF